MCQRVSQDSLHVRGCLASLHNLYCAVISWALGNSGGSVAGWPPLSTAVMDLNEINFCNFLLTKLIGILLMVIINMPECFLASASPHYIVVKLMCTYLSHWCSLPCHQTYSISYYTTHTHTHKHWEISKVKTITLGIWLTFNQWKEGAVICCDVKTG